MELKDTTVCGSPYADMKVVLRRMSGVSDICPKCRKPCDFEYVLSTDSISFDILCPDCGKTRIITDVLGDEVVYRIEGTGEIYNNRANLDDAEARLKAVEGDPQEEILAMAEVAWENYLIAPSDALPVWEEAVDRFDSCDDIDVEHARGMVPWILRFCDLGGDDLSEIDLTACAKAADVLGRPSTAEECMLWMDLFLLRCASNSMDDDVAAIPDLAKGAYRALPESERGKCPAFPAISPLMQIDYSTHLWNAGYIDLEEHELDDYDAALWDEAVSETRKMLEDGFPMTPRLFRTFYRISEPVSLTLGAETVIGQFEELAGMSGEYGDAFRGLAGVMDVLMKIWGEAVIPYFKKPNYRWTDEAYAELEDVIEKLEKYADPGIVTDVLADAYRLQYEHDRVPDILEYCDQLIGSAENRLLDVRQRICIDTDMLRKMCDSIGNGKPQNKTKPKGKSKKERVAERRRAHIAKRR